MGELSIALDVGDLTPEERLSRIRELKTFVHAQMGRAMPRSVVAEDEARRSAGGRSLQKQLEDFDRQLCEDGWATVFVLGEDGELHEDVYVPFKGQIVGVNDDEQSSFSNLSEPAMAWLHAEVRRQREALIEAERLVQVDRLTESGIIAEMIEDLARRQPSRKEPLYEQPC